MAMIAFNKYGETPLEDISGLKLKLTTRSELDDAESLNIHQAYLAYTLDQKKLKKLTFDLPAFQKIHKKMFGEVWSWAGELRTIGTSIGVEATQIRNKLYQLCDDLKYWEKDWDYQDTATKLHHTLVFIHPFLNGNGRWSRLITELWLLKTGKELPFWGMHQVDLTTDELRKNYIMALQEADKKNYIPLKIFMFQ